MKSARKAMAMMIPEQQTQNGTPDSRLLSDRLSCLEESIIFHIFSFLGANDTFRLSLLSKKFKELCFNSPYLDFHVNFDSDRQERNYLFYAKNNNELLLHKRYTQFCKYVDNVMRSREKHGTEIVRFSIHWFGKVYSTVGCSIIDSWVKFATRCNVKELDILLDFDGWKNYCLPGTVFGCQSLKSLRLNLLMNSFFLAEEYMVSVQKLVLVSVKLTDKLFGAKISDRWGSLKRLDLVKVRCIYDLIISSSSLEELNLDDCHFGSHYCDWHLTIRSSSLKSVTISRCLFVTLSRISFSCLSLENFTDHGSKFKKFVGFKLFYPKKVELFGPYESDIMKVSASLDIFRIFGSHFENSCSFFISYPSVKQIEISNCKFAEFCQLKIDSSSLLDLTISDCEIVSPERKNFNTDLKRRIVINSETLDTLTLNSFDKYSNEFPLSVVAPNLRTIRWGGDPVDFSFLENFMALEVAAIAIKPSCQHKSRELACCCKHFKSSIYCVAALLQSLNHVKVLKINIWPIEMFFMQNDEVMYFDNLERLILVADDSLVEQVPIIASFLKGLPNLNTLWIRCQNKSHLIGDPNFIDSLGLCGKSFGFVISEDVEKIVIVKLATQAEGSNVNVNSLL
ncbi:uncharacterized protein LOC126674556 [Mercurialis annua]|uniref:uncharacterized protein LOC126674556 n=1 Tax=Mercurialis annua TaxID=3986 RepID=UPI00215E7A27|nr:uncharacterized protein LOC126674556 [Mercurialis annua]XP_055959858.1 uncharacterized protein LOC126674556 [Mercurialis annua]